MGIALVLGLAAGWLLRGTLPNLPGSKPPGETLVPERPHLPWTEPTPLPLDPEVGFFDPGDGFLDIPETVTPAWQERVRQELRKLLKPRPPGVAAVLESDTGPEAWGDVSLHWLRFQVSDGHRIYAVWLKPSGRDGGPLIVALHGHGGGLSVEIEPGSGENALALELARAGFQVLVIETRTFGRSAYPELGHQAYVQRLRLQGKEFHGQVVSDNLEILSWARQAIPNDGRLAVVGFSMGGFSAMFLGALGGPFEACLVSGAGGSWRLGLASYATCPCSNPAGLLTKLDADQVFAAMSCRSIALELGRKDPYLGTATLVDHGDALLAVARRRGVALEIHDFDGPHRHNPDYVIGYLRRALGVDPP